MYIAPAITYNQMNEMHEIWLFFTNQFETIEQ